MIDVRTILLLLIVDNLVLGGFFLAYRESAGRPGWRRLWIAAKFAEPAGLVFLLLRSQIPDWISIVLGNGFLTFGFALELYASWEFLHLKSWRRYFPALYAVSAAVFLGAYAAGAGIEIRTFVISTISAILFSLTAAGFFIRRRVISNVGWVVSISDMLVAVTMAARAAWSLLSANFTLFSNLLPQVLGFGALFIFTLVNGLGFLFIAHEEAESALREGRDELSRAQKTAGFGSISIDLLTGLDRWSDELYRLLRFDPAQVKGSFDLFLSRVHPEDREAFTAVHNAYRRGEDAGPFEYRVILPRGEQRWFRRHAEIARGPSGKTVSLRVTHQDVTQQKSTEAQLAQAQKMEAVGQLTGGIAHDFNNLLAVIMGWLQMVDEDLVNSPELRARIRSCIKAVEKGSTLTKNLLAFSRSQAFALTDLDLAATIHEMEDMLRRALTEEFDLRISLAPSLWRVAADPGQVQNALLNLVLNARDAMPAGGTVTISAANQRIDATESRSHPNLSPGDYAVLSVADEGVGMPPEVIEHAFEPFYTTKDVDKGSGLGLSMVYGFARQSGGEAAIDSALGRGTTVRVYLPRLTGIRAAPSDGTVASHPDGTGAETILVIEDNADLREVAKLQLERSGYRVICASFGDEGLRLLTEHREIDLLLCDVILPQRMNGPEVARRALAIRPDLRIVFMSGYNEEREELERFKEISPLRLLRKPFRAEEMIEQIRLALTSV